MLEASWAVFGRVLRSLGAVLGMARVESHFSTTDDATHDAADFWVLATILKEKANKHEQNDQLVVLRSFLIFQASVVKIEPASLHFKNSFFRLVKVFISENFEW